jgi:hypothetical protein
MLIWVNRFIDYRFSSSVGLFPSVFNLAESAVDIFVNATCGEHEPEVFCTLASGVAADAAGRYTADQHGRQSSGDQHGRQSGGGLECGVCDASRADRAHSVDLTMDGDGGSWWQSPSLQYGGEYNYVTITIDLKNVKISSSSGLDDLIFISSTFTGVPSLLSHLEERTFAQAGKLGLGAVVERPPLDEMADLRRLRPRVLARLRRGANAREAGLLGGRSSHLHLLLLRHQTLGERRGESVELHVDLPEVHELRNVVLHVLLVHVLLLLVDSRELDERSSGCVGSFRGSGGVHPRQVHPVETANALAAARGLGHP